MSITLASLLDTGEGYPGDPVNQRAVDINTVITALNAALTAVVNSFGRGVATLLDTTTSIVVTRWIGF